MPYGITGTPSRLRDAAGEEMTLRQVRVQRQNSARAVLGSLEHRLVKIGSRLHEAPVQGPECRTQQGVLTRDLQPMLQDCQRTLQLSGREAPDALSRAQIALVGVDVGI